MGRGSPWNEITFQAKREPEKWALGERYGVVHEMGCLSGSLLNRVRVDGALLVWILPPLSEIQFKIKGRFGEPCFRMQSWFNSEHKLWKQLSKAAHHIDGLRDTSQTLSLKLALTCFSFVYLPPF